MKSNLISYFESVKFGNAENIDIFLSKEEENAVLNWYNIHVNESGNIYSALQFMYELYIRENLDVYEVTEFQRVVKSLSDEYGFDVKNFLSILEEYRIFIYE